MSEFRQPALKELTEQLAGTDKRKSLVPVGKRRAQFERAGQLLAEIDPAKNYPYPFVCFRVTGFRSDAYPDLLIPGGDLRHDLKRLYERLDKSLPPLPIEQAAEPLLTLAQVSRLLKVSAKTVRRWKSGCDLVGRRVLVNGRRQVGFLQSVVARFLAANRDRVERGGRFSHLSEAEKDEILTHARLLARGGGTLTEVSRRIARRLGRSAETIRYTIKNFDREHPDQALFPDLTGPLDRPTKQMIYNSYRRGITVDTLAKRFQRTRTSMYRVINEVRAERLLKQPLGLHLQPLLRRPGARRPRSWPPCRTPRSSRRSGRNMQRAQGRAAGAGAALRGAAAEQGAGAAPVPQDELPQAQGCRSCVDRLRKPGRHGRPGQGPHRRTWRRSRSCRSRSNAVKDLLINCNMRLVVSIAKRHVGPDGQLLRAALRRQHVADPGGREVRLQPRQQVQHLRQLGDHEELRPQHPGGEAPPRALRDRPRGAVRRRPGQPDRRARAALDGRAGRAPGQPAAGVPEPARARDHPHAGRPGRQSRR